MARQRRCFEDTTAFEIYNCYKNHAEQTATLPNPHAFWERILVPQLGYQMPYGSFQYHWMQLQIRALIKVDEITKAVSVPELVIREKNSAP